MRLSPSRKLAVAYWPLERLTPDPRNPRRHPEEQLQQLVASIEAFGWTNPILVEPGGTIVAGEARWLAAQRCGLQSVPVIVLAHLSEVERRAYLVADNRLPLGAHWDEELLAQVLQDLNAAHFDTRLTGFTPAETTRLLDALLAKHGVGERDDDAAPPLPEEPITRRGDVWQLGDHRLLCGDSTVQDEVARLIEGEGPVDLVFTDPPYGMSYKARNFAIIAGDNLRDAALIDFLTKAFKVAVALKRETAALYACLTWRTFAEFEDALTGAGLAISACLVWDKGWPGPGMQDYRPQHEMILQSPDRQEFLAYSKGDWYGDRAQSDVWSLPRDPAGTYVHPTQKPVALIERALRYSSRQGNRVLDLFGGSGSTLIACEKLRRRARLVELDPRYCDVIVRRWQDYADGRALRHDGLPFGQAAH